MTPRSTLSEKSILNSPPLRTTQQMSASRLSRKGKLAAKNCGHEVATDAIGPMFRALGTITAMVIIGAMLLMGTELFKRNTPTLADAEQACTSTVARHAPFGGTATVETLAAKNMQSSWLISGRAIVKGQNITSEFHWRCSYLIDLGVSRITDVRPAAPVRTASVEDRHMLVSLLIDVGLWK